MTLPADLESPDPSERTRAGFLYSEMARSKKDISDALPQLVRALGDRYWEVQCYAAEALTHHYFSQKEWPLITGLLEHPDYYVRRHGAFALLQIATQNESMEPLLPVLLRRLKSLDGEENYTVRKELAAALLSYYWKRNETEAMVRLLENADGSIWLGAIETLRGCADNAQTVEGLDRIQRMVETHFPSYLQRTAQACSSFLCSERARRIEEVKELLEEAAAGKAFLAKKKDSELLTGETIVVSRKPSLYQSMRRLSVGGK